MNRSWCIAAIIILGPFSWFFGPVFLRGELFVFRDGAHYYQPLFQWTDQQWPQGSPPLWNPQENSGVALAADATASLFYPGKLIFLAPLDFTTRYNLYIALHLLLAAGAAFTLARSWRASTLAAALCGLAYAFGGNVLFQYCNVVYLVGAAWLPLGWLAVEQMLRRRSLAWALGLGVVLALMILGGDPQGAYHVMLLAALYAWLLGGTTRRGKKEHRQHQTDHQDSNREQNKALLNKRGWLRRNLKNRPALLLFAAASGAILASVQILPAMQWSSQSRRAAYENPRSIYESAIFLSRQEQPVQSAPLIPEDSQTSKQSHWGGISKGLFGQPAAGEHHETIYHFSVAPWRLAEFVWPNVSGKLFPRHRRWTTSIPAEGRIWTPSLYMGLLPLFLGLGVWRLRGSPIRWRWTSWVLLLSTLGALGWYGCGWLVYEIRFALSGARDVSLGQPVGGLYWLFVVFLPGYAYFRFPAKLLTIAALALSLLAARGWDRMMLRNPIRLRRALALCGSLSMLLMLVIAALAVSSQFGVSLKNFSAAVPSDDYFGPFDEAGTITDLFKTMLHTTLLCSLLWILLRRMEGEKKHRKSRWALLLLATTAMELTIANSWLAPSAAKTLLSAPAKIAVSIENDWQPRGGIKDPVRVYRGSPKRWHPQSWRSTSSQDRLQTGFAWEYNTLYPKHHLHSGSSLQTALLETPGALQSYDYYLFLQSAKDHGPRRSDGIAEPHLGVLNALGAEYLLLPERAIYPNAKQIERDATPENSLEDAFLFRNPDCFPRAWLVHRWEILPPLDSAAPSNKKARTEYVLFPDGFPRDLAMEAVLETELSLPSSPASPNAEKLESCRLVAVESERIEIDALLASPGLLVLSDLYYPGWIVETTDAETKQVQRRPILRANRVMRGVMLPAGHHHVEFRYRPSRVYLGGALSITAWLAAIAFGGVILLRRRRSSRALTH